MNAPAPEQSRVGDQRRSAVAPGERAYPDVEGYFDDDTNAICYIVENPPSDSCAVIDSILDLDVASGTLSTP